MTELLFHGFVYTVIGIFAGLMAGVLGIGGGIIVVPGLAFLFQLSTIIPDEAIMHVASGTSLAVMVCTSQFALKAHFKLGEVLWPVYHKLWSGIILGVISGALLAECITTFWLEIIFGVFLLVIAVKMLTDVHTTHTHREPGTWLNRVVSYWIGTVSGLLGVGGGVLIIPYLTYCGIDPRKIAPISSLCTLTVGFLGALIFMVTGYNEMAAIPYSTGYVYWPAVLLIAIPSSLFAPLGAKLNYILPVKQMKYGFVVILFITAIKMLF